MDSSGRRIRITRRGLLLTGGAALVGAGSIWGTWQLVAPPKPDSRGWPRFFLRRQQDELFVELVAVGFREFDRLGRRQLRPVEGHPQPLFIFTFAPQHFAETAIATTTIPPVFGEDQLGKIELLASKPSRLVFRVPARWYRLDLGTLLDWTDFELVLPDLDQVAARYDLDFVEPADRPVTRVEMPWGIELTPLEKKAGEEAIPHRWHHTLDPQTSGHWNVLWTTSLVGQTPRTEFEVLGVRGFRRGSLTGNTASGGLRVTYDDAPGVSSPKDPTPLRNADRIDIAASLSRRFPYTGRVGPPPIESGLIQYTPTNACISACYADGRAVEVEQFRLSARGGWLQLDGQWVAFPGCGLTGWVHTASLGRDHHVEVVNAGFLYPFGTACELVVLSERAFVRDSRGHFVAVLIKQVFLQIPQPNDLAIGHYETPFRAVAVTTKRTPPLDLPPGGDPGTYRDYDFFLPTVGQRPFSFEHAGTDWAGKSHLSSMPMYFVSNKARSANGLIWEPGHRWNHSQQSAVCGVAPAGNGDAPHTIPRSADSEGLRVIDRLWNADPHRFAQYNGALMALATPTFSGDTTHRVDWVEWVRGNIPDLMPTMIVPTPFRPRSRTMRLRLAGMGQMSGQPSASIATYRDTRFTSAPVLDPEPTTDPKLYFVNVQPESKDPAAAYLFLLETRALVGEAAAVAVRPSTQASADIRQLYYGTAITPSRIPDSLFADIDNEIRFGHSTSSEGVGGLSVPDTHVSILTRKNGPVGDATFNEGRWSGYDALRRSSAEAIGRLDYAGYRLRYRSQIDVQPFDRLRNQEELGSLQQLAKGVMGFAAAPAAFAPMASGLPSGGLRLGDLFGKHAQILPGLGFADVFRNVPLGNTASRGSDERAAQPLTWDVKINGVEWLTAIIGSGPGQVSLPEFITLFQNDLQDADSSEPVPFGIEASLNWSNDVFRTEAIGPVKFTPNGSTRMTINASARMDFGKLGFPADATQLSFEPGKARMAARAELRDFTVTVFGAIEVRFSSVAFVMTEDGNKDFITQIAGVDLIGPLSFINQLSNVLGGLGQEQGISLSLTPERIRISQTLRFPTTEGDPLFIGPAQITNLALGWFVMIPLRGRDVLSVGFSVSSREKPLAIFVPPWYGGKAHVLLEATTRGCRLVEVCMEYGALIPISWGIARGEASLMAGIFYMCERDDATNSGRVVMRAFVKAKADLSVAGIIHFMGLIYIALSYVQEAGRKLVRGEATVRVSIKIGFVRISYSFTAAHEEESGGDGRRASLLSPMHLLAATSPPLPPAGVSALTHSSVANGAPGDVRPFGGSFDARRREAFNRILAAYARRAQRV